MADFTKKAGYHFRMAKNDALFKMGLGKSLHRNRKGGRILIFHGIDETGRTDLNTRFISKEYFEQQIAYFAEHFNIVTLDEYWKGEFAEDKLTVAITFDDGLANNLKHALPILEKYNAPATFFITTIRDAGQDILWPDFIDVASSLTDSDITIDGKVFSKGKNNEYWHDGKRLKQLCNDNDVSYLYMAMEAFPYHLGFKTNPDLEDYWRMMTEEELQELAASPLVTIGSHGMFHTNLDKQDFWFAYEEMKRSKEYLERVIGNPIKALAYPNGRYTRKIAEAAAELGYSQQLAVDFLHKADAQDNHLRERFGVNPFISWNNQLASILKGSY